MKLSQSGHSGTCAFCRGDLNGKGGVVLPHPFGAAVYLCGSCAADPSRVGDLVGSAVADSGADGASALRAFMVAFNAAFSGN